MRKAIIGLAVLMLMAVSVSANWYEPTMPVMPGNIVEPKLPYLPQSVFVDIDNGKFEQSHNVWGGWFYDGGWTLEDFGHKTAMLEETAQTSGALQYTENWVDSGTEASGMAWKFGEMSELLMTGNSEADNKLSAVTVNPVPPGGEHTQLFYEQFDWTDGAMVHSLVVDGEAVNPSLIQTHYETSLPFVQWKVVGVNLG
jgi:hypothetical protein